MPTGVYERTAYHRGINRESQKGKILSKKHKQNIGKGISMDRNPNWNGGKRMANGYIMVLNRTHPFCNNSGYIYEHRLVMEKHLGRTLLPTEVVHHIDGNKTNNKIENLMLFNKNKDHARHHSKKLVEWNKLNKKEK